MTERPRREESPAAHPSQSDPDGAFSIRGADEDRTWGESGHSGLLCSGATPEEVFADLAPLLEFREEGLDADRLSKMLEERLLPHLVRYDLPSFHALFNAFPEEGALLGARIALAWNQGVTNWQVSPGGSMLEELCCRALCRLFGLSPGSDATLLYSGTYANQQALYMALHHRAQQEGFDFAQEGLQGFREPARLAVATSEDAHFSLKHAVRTLGLGERALVTIPVDRNRKMDVGALRDTMKRLEPGQEVFCVVATAGTTPTGAVDPLNAVADLCSQVGTWLHVDGAYGLAYALVPEWRDRFAGVERADTVSWDPHKQMGVPIPCSVLFARKRDDFRRMALFSHYWNRPDSEGPNPGMKSMPSTRPLSALPLVTSIRYQGLQGVAERLGKPLAAIRSLAEALSQEPDIELCHEPDTGILCFRLVPEFLPPEAQDRLQETVYRTILKQGRRLVSIATLNGRAALRFVAVGPDVTTEVMLESVAEARRIARAFR
jgi:L-2,4-diaminobutyrate decarboxylase